MEPRKDILEFIHLCNKIWGRYDDFTGGCYKFSKLLISVFGGTMYWSHDHIITLIDGVYYDIDGVHEVNSKFFVVGSEYASKEYVDKVYSEYI